ncbi:MAG: hypothetical protein MK135_03775 [Polyangiaceae bacterium]|nr:hypothetical protein [Polyangiaceae bacterium]
MKSSSVAQVAREQAIAALIELPDVSDQELARLSETRIIEAAEIFELVPPDEKKTP